MQDETLLAWRRAKDEAFARVGESPLLEEAVASFSGLRYFEPDPALPEGVYTAAELAARLPERCRVVGEGVAVCAEVIAAARGADALLVPPPAGDARAAAVGAIGAQLLARGAAWDAASIVPRYVRRAEAEVKRTGRRFEGL